MFIILMMMYFIANTLSRLLVRVFAQKTQLRPYTASATITVSSALGMSIFGFCTAKEPILRSISPIVIFVIICIGIMAAYFGKLSMTAQKHVDTANFIVIRQVSVPTSVLLATLMLGEGMKKIQLLGMAVTLAGSYIVGSGGKKIKINQFGRYELHILASGLFLGLYAVSSRFIEQKTSLSTLLVLGGICEVISSIYMARNEARLRYTISDFVYIVLIGTATTIHVASFWLATKIADNISIVSTLGTLRIIPIFLASYLFLKEKDNLVLKLIGCGISIIGLMLL